MADTLCAYCRKGPRAAEFAPFCSPGCQDRDLLQWLRGGYALPSASEDDDFAGNDPLDKDGTDR